MDASTNNLDSQHAREVEAQSNDLFVSYRFGSLSVIHALVPMPDTACWMERTSVWITDRNLNLYVPNVPKVIGGSVARVAKYVRVMEQSTSGFICFISLGYKALK